MERVGREGSKKGWGSGRGGFGGFGGSVWVGAFDIRKREKDGSPFASSR